MATPMYRIGNRQSQLLARASGLEGHRYLTSAEVSALRHEEARGDRLAGTPVLAPKQIARFRAIYEISGAPRRSGVKRTDGFCGVLQRHRRHQLRVGAQKLRSRARALDKVAKSYVFRPSVVNA